MKLERTIIHAWAITFNGKLIEAVNGTPILYTTEFAALMAIRIGPPGRYGGGKPVKVVIRVEPTAIRGKGA